MPTCPPPLQAGDTIRIVSPASTPDPNRLEQQTAIFESWGLNVELAEHVLDKHGFLAGTDADRAADINHAFRDPKVRAVIASRGGKGSYRLIDRIDYSALRNDPKFLVGFSDITALHFAVWNQSRMVSLHGGLFGQQAGQILENTRETLRLALMQTGSVSIQAREQEPTSILTTTGVARGHLLGGSLDIVTTSAGWLLPDLRNTVLLLEANDIGPGYLDRSLMMLRRSGCLAQIAGIAIGQFHKANHSAQITIIDLLREHLEPLGVPILGGLPIGHGHDPVTVPLGRMVRLDADTRCLQLES